MVATRRGVNHDDVAMHRHPKPLPEPLREFVWEHKALVDFAFFHEVGVDYVSCSPFRVPIARLAAAQAALQATFKDR